MKGLEKPDEYRKLILKLGEAEILDEKFSDNFSEVAGFRNILVHQYAEINSKTMIFLPGKLPLPGKIRGLILTR